jgi:hypothetical protein
MKIECILKRPGGTKADIDGIEYHFAPQPDGAHVAEVTKNEHIQRFLSIDDAYRIYGEPATIEDLDKDGDVDTKDERLALSEQYKEKFGKAPHHKLSLDAIRQKLAE